MTDKLSTYGLIGHPLGHSFSQRYFTAKFAAAGIEARYDNFDIPSVDDLTGIIRNNPNLKGLNVTIPYKEAVIRFLDEIDPKAEKIGAVNVLRITRNGNDVRLKGFNTDVTGFTESIRPYLKPCHDKALVLGTGGASKAVVAGLEGMGLKVSHVSRRSGSGQLTYDDLTEEVMKEHTVIVNATPLGTFPDTESCPPIPYRYMTDRHLCFDLVYNPADTMFMKNSRRHGATTINGSEMLRIQAEEAWKIWNS